MTLCWITGGCGNTAGFRATGLGGVGATDGAGDGVPRGRATAKFFGIAGPPI